VKKNYIIRLRGGFGNQFFQYLNAVNIERSYKSRIILDYSQVYRNHDKVGISAFKVKYMTTRILNDYTCYLLNSRIFKKLQNLIPLYLLEDLYISRESIERIIGMPKIKLEIKNEFRTEFKKSLEVSNNMEVIVHLRLGDMYNIGLASNESYLRKALSSIEQFYNKKYFIYTDDMINFESCYEKVFLDLELDYAVVTANLKAVHLFSIFSESKIFIGTNSTLSLISALLNYNKNATILLPRFVSSIDLTSIKSISKNWLLIQ
jgi:hypothetical protein